jgi:hypothetical protein
MNSVRFAAVLVFAILGATGASLSHAQATRTWVSGVGDDANPCSRTAPCKTFAGAISKTAAGGEISVLDPGGYGAVTITKSMTIDGGGGAGFGSILNSGTTGVIINAGVNDVVTLRNLSINGAGAVPGIAGIRILQAKRVYVEKVQVFGNGGADPSGRGISDTRSTGGQLFISDSIIRNNSQSGVVIIPASGSTTIDVSIRNSELKANGNAGIAATSGAHVNISNSKLAGNTNHGLYMEEAAGDTQVSLTDCIITDSLTGITMGTGNPTLILSGVTVTDNNTGMVRGSGPVFTFNNNRFIGNLSGNGPFVPAFTTATPL